jgi:GDP-fucose transporter C1
MDVRYSIDAPLFMTWYQCMVTVLILWLLGRLGASAKPDSFFKQFPVITISASTAYSVIQLSLVFVGMVTFNNLCLKYVEVSFYNVARALTAVSDRS